MAPRAGPEWPVSEPSRSVPLSDRRILSHRENGSRKYVLAGLALAALARGSNLLRYEVNGEKAFWSFQVIDLTSEVKGSPSTFNSRVNCVVSRQATHCFF